MVAFRTVFLDFIYCFYWEISTTVCNLLQCQSAIKLVFIYFELPLSSTGLSTSAIFWYCFQRVLYHLQLSPSVSRGVCCPSLPKIKGEAKCICNYDNSLLTLRLRRLISPYLSPGILRYLKSMWNFFYFSAKHCTSLLFSTSIGQKCHSSNDIPHHTWWCRPK